MEIETETEPDLLLVEVKDAQTILALYLSDINLQKFTPPP